ncbi:MAG: hypothetical protein ACKOKE_04560 [Actinomycetota bacterium]
MRRKALALSMLLAAAACGGSAAQTPADLSTAPTEAVETAPIELTAEPRFLDLPSTPEVWPADLTEDDYTPYSYFYYGHRLQPGLPDFAEWCAERGLIDDPVLFLKRERWFDAVCMEPYLRSRSVPEATIALFVRTSIVIGAMTSVGPVSVGRGAVQDERYVNDAWGLFVFTPAGMLDLRDAFPSEELWAFWAAIEATDMFAEIRALHDADPPLEAQMWWDVGMDAPTATSEGYAVPLEWRMHEDCHACTTPYGIRSELRFDRSGEFEALVFDGFCWTGSTVEGWGPDPLGLPDCGLLG